MLFLAPFLPMLALASPVAKPQDLTIIGSGISELTPIGGEGSITPLTPSGSGGEINPLAKRQAPNPNEITIVSTKFSGSGCPQGTVSTSLSPDGTVVTFGFDSFQTYIGPGTSIKDHTKNCQLHLDLNYPGGFEFAVIDATYHGYAQLDPGVSGTFYSTYFFSQDASATCLTEADLSGNNWAAGAVYEKDDEIETADVVYSPCGITGLLNVNNRIALSSNATTASGQITDDDATVAFTHQIHLAWQPCTKK